MKRPPPNNDGDCGSKRRRRMSWSEEDDSRQQMSSKFGEAPPFHKIYNSSNRKEKPDELFRKDLISAMKLPDSEQLDDSDFWGVADTWKQEWERGVQVPVNSKNVPNPNVRIFRDKSKTILFKQPKKLMRTTEDEFFNAEHHVLIDTAAKAESVCKYDMDDMDLQWLMLFNNKREDLGLTTIDEDTMERILEDFETQCSNRFQDALKTEKGLGIEYDEDVICDVCRSPECEEGNEMVFCDSCNICVHQACYGIMAIPEGSWICRPCAANVKPSCVLCPNPGGAMKSTSSGDKWAHVSCALWIPEVSIGCPEKMEPILRISHIPASRWALICSICRERGACIQCSVKQCKVAYHVTCAFENGLEMEMKTTAIDSSEEGVKMQSFCPKHSKTENNAEKPIILKPPRKRRKKKEVVKVNTEEENEVDEHNARLQKIRCLEAQFHRYVSIKDTSDLHHVDSQVVEFIYYYWVLKRRAKFNKPLLITKCDEANLLIKQHENLLYSRLKMFVHLRQDLERVRNLCYMVSRREKIFRSYLRARRDIFEKQNEIMTEIKLPPQEVEEIINARKGDNLFDKFYSFNYEEYVREEAANRSNAPKLTNPYAKSYSNSMHTRSQRRTTSQNMSENFDSESNEMPTLVKYKSEENLHSNDGLSRELNFSSSTPVKVELEETAGKRVIKKELEALKEIKREESLEPKGSEIDAAKNNLENSKMKRHAVENSNDKNSLCLSDKENINAFNSMKVKRTRSQADTKHTEIKNNLSDLTSPKLEMIDNDNSISIADDTRNFIFDRRKTRYQMRNRRFSQELLESEVLALKFAEAVDTGLSSPPDISSSPSSSADEIPVLSKDQTVSPVLADAMTPQSVKRRRGRPKKSPPELLPVTLPVIVNEVPNGDNNTPFEEALELSDEETGFRMSLRHGREAHCPKKSDPKPKVQKTSVVKVDQKENSPLKEAPNDIAGQSESPPQWDTDTQPPRLVIRLRKDPHRESWKNDSSSDVPVAFRIVHPDFEVNGNSSELSSVVNNDSPPDSCCGEGEGRHRYAMRDRLSRNTKSNLEKS